ncbi:1-aminocyclopropane-1-carboxylate deaminase/D-cysteine desulfhydrase [Sporichthya sp.]|uniref:1-aminocyclopropane-1-carboxylate deaminase/D-cysteine desulfhydrase n=1 Tax=Sporichthya sp. TaxID=65475 RepID=UPI001837C72E|nr:pyridoxal-phosphate dependent enzyme [Sporichthya sp.]MBA3745079.1 pyridoxal-phosphate dependent enzyme [Sporichthya sp.]
MNPHVGLSAQPRTRLGTFPTPLHPAPRLSVELGVEVWFKRDDLTGLGLGGNKVRALEYVLGDAERVGADTLVTGGGPASNWAMLAALAARTRGLDAVLVMYGDPVPATGNLALAELAGARVVFTGDTDRTSVDRGVADEAAKLVVDGRRPYSLGRGGATPVGALGYVAGTLELVGQLHERALEPATVWTATGSCGTQSGLVAGASWLRPGYRVVGVSVSRPVEECTARIADTAAGACALIGAPAPVELPEVRGDQLGAYGRRSDSGADAARLVARTEGVFLDPVFAAKAMAGLISAAADSRVEGPVIFLVTGGAPTLFFAK